MICQSCGVEAPTQKVLFVQHIGAVVMFFHKRIGGNFCRNCVRKYFGEYTLKTLFLGWWGMISVFATPVVLLINIANWFRAWSLAPVPNGAGPPTVTDDVVARLTPHVGNLIDRLNAGEALQAVCADIGQKAGVTAGQVTRFVQLLVEHQKAQPQ